MLEKNKSVRVQISMSEEFKANVKKYADRNELDFSTLVRIALVYYIEKNPRNSMKNKKIDKK